MTWWDAALAVLLGSACVGCGDPGRPWCAQCTQDLQGAVDPVALAQAPLVVACAAYDGCVPAAVVGFKDRGVRVLGPELAHVLAAGLLAAVDLGVTGATVVPAPSAPSAVRRRGFDHMAQVAARAADVAGLPCRRLLRGGGRVDQAGLGFAARRRNVRGTMRVRVGGQGSVIVVDDVRTSGATLAECERALLMGGYTVLAHVVIAAAI